MLRTLSLGLALCFLVRGTRAQELVVIPQPAEELVVRFDTMRTTLDDGGVHILGLQREPSESLLLPDVDTTNARFVTLYYSRDVAGHEGDHKLSILAIPHPDGILLYADLNNDEDLRNDGLPHLLADTSDFVTFALVAPNDSLQITHRTVAYVPDAVRRGRLSPEWFAGMMDEEGNLRPVFANLYGIDGERGTFLFDDRPVLARGVLPLGEDTLAIGVYDMNANGRYDDEEDLLLVDLDRDGFLTFSGENAHVFRLDEVFEVDERRFRLNFVDPYGRGICIVEVTDPPSFRYRAEQRAAFEVAVFEPRARHDLDSTFWGLELTTLDGDTLRLSDLRGRPILLNVWGEWCGPCRMEMPSLVLADSALASEGLRIVGVLSTADEASARDYLDEIGAMWPQVRMTELVRERLDVRSYPTNLLIASDGLTAVEAGVVNLRFLRTHLDGR